MNCQHFQKTDYGMIQVKTLLATAADCPWCKIERLKTALRYWLPDETMIPEGHEVAWNEHVQLIPEHRDCAVEPGTHE